MIERKRCVQVCSGLLSWFNGESLSILEWVSDKWVKSVLDWASGRRLLFGGKPIRG